MIRRYRVRRKESGSFFSFFCLTQLESRSHHCSLFRMEEGPGNVEDSMVRCPECDKLLKKKSLVRHLREIHPKNGSIFPCPHCEKQFSRKSNLTRHIESNHSDQVGRKTQAGDASKKFNCTICGLYFKQKSHYIEHLQIHQGFRFECPHCKKNFSRATTLKQHIQSVHPDAEPVQIKGACILPTAGSSARHAASCKSIAFLPHNGHIDFLRTCGSVSCRNDTCSCTSTDGCVCCSSVSLEHAGCQHQHPLKRHGLAPHSHSQEQSRVKDPLIPVAPPQPQCMHHSSCTRVAYLKHEDHVDFLHSCGSLFCQDVEVPIGLPLRSHENLHPFTTHCSEEGRGVCHPEGHDHNSCKSVAFLPHNGHVDFLQSCGTVSCRHSLTHTQAPTSGNSSIESDSSAHESSCASASSEDFTDATEPVAKKARVHLEGPAHSHSHHGHHSHQYPDPNGLEHSPHDHDHSGCTKVACLKHDDHVDYLHSCGSLFCHDEEVYFGQGSQIHNNLSLLDQDIVSSLTNIFE